MKIDPYKHKERYLRWKEQAKKVGIPNISKESSKIICDYIFDMEQGLNISRMSSRGSRSYTRLNNIKQRMTFMTKEFERRYKIKSLLDLTERQVFEVFNAMRTGEIRRVDGGEYKSVGDFVKIFKAFWNWWIKVNRKKSKEIFNIAQDLDTSITKPKWVYLDEGQLKKLVEHAKFEYKALIMFLYDSGIRSPTELINIKVSDLRNNFKELEINDEISKTFGRKIKLLLCADLLKSYIESKQLQPQDYLFPISGPVVNRYLQRLAKRLFGDAVSDAGKKYLELTMYDFRHCSCCYWLPRYKSESALKYRFGWKKSDKIHYYSELLGMKDTISEEDLLIDVTKTEIEKRLVNAERDNGILKERLEIVEQKMLKIQELTDKVDGLVLKD